MRQIRWKLWILIFAALAILLGVYYYGTFRTESEGEPPAYAVILYQHSSDEWESLMEGIDQASDDFRVNVRYVTMEENWTAQQQLDLIEREAGSGVSGILLAAVDSEKVGEGLQEMNLQIPIVTVETGAEGFQAAGHISADNYAMGEELGRRILADMEANGRYETVTVIREYLERSSVQERYRGLTDTLRDAGVATETISRQAGDFDLSLFVEKEFAASGDYIAALDKFCTAEAADALDSSSYEDMDAVRIYGIGNTAQTVNDLDSGRLAALVFQNEFNMGYEGIRALSDIEEKGYLRNDISIMYKLVTRDTLYENENERLLFPSI